jgi:hypothetical protein
VSFWPPVSRIVVDVGEVLVSGAIGLDVHRDFCVVAICEGGRARVAESGR